MILLRSHGYSHVARRETCQGYTTTHEMTITHKLGVLDKCAEMRISYGHPSSKKREQHDTQLPERTKVKVMITCDN